MAAAVAAGLVAGLLVALVVPSTYRASGAVILVRQGRPPGSDPGIARAIVAAKGLLLGRAVADSAVANLKLDESADELLDDVTVTAEPETSLIRLSVEAGDGEQARRIAQELAEVFTVLYNGRFGPATTASIWEVPRAQEAKVAPRPPLYIGSGGVLGLLVGAGLLVARRKPVSTVPPPAPAPAPAPAIAPTPAPPPRPAPPPTPAVDERLQKRVAAVTARELGLARRAAELARRERELAESPPAQPELTVAETVAETPPEIEPEIVVPFVLPQRGSWTIADVERLLAEQGEAFPDRVEELGFYADSFRDIAEPDGRLPAGVEVVLEDVFAELIDRVRSASG